MSESLPLKDVSMTSGSAPDLDLDEDEVRLLLLWAWRYAKTRNTFAPDFVRRTAQRHKHILTERDLKEILGGGEPSGE